MSRPLSTVQGRLTRSFLMKQPKEQLADWVLSAAAGERPADIVLEVCHAANCNHEIFIAPWVDRCPACGEKRR